MVNFKPKTFQFRLATNYVVICLVILLLIVTTYFFLGESKNINILLFAGAALIVLLFFLSFLYISSTIKNAVEQANKPIQILSKGNLPHPEVVPQNEIGPLVEGINELTKNLSKIKDFALEVGSGHYDSQTTIFNNQGEIGKSLYEMRHSLSKIASDEKERSWFNEGFAKFNDVIRQNNHDIKALSQTVISQIVKYLNANQGGIFILNDDNKDHKYLELLACYAYERNKFLKKEILPGEGLVGQCFLEKQSIYLTDVPQDYINITSGLGGANPDNIFIVPLLFNQNVLGIIEIASFNRFKPIELEFIQKIAESIGSSISSVKISQNTQRLLRSSQLAAEQLKSQEEEMRQNMEELAATQEEMHRNQQAVIENEQKTRLIFLNAFDAIVTTDEFGIIDLFNPAAERIFGYTSEEVQGRSINIFLNHEAIGIDTEIEIFAVIGIAQEIDAKRKNGQSFIMRIKIEKGSVGNKKVYLAFIEDITPEKLREKEMQQELLNYKNRIEELSETHALQQVSKEDQQDEIKAFEELAKQRLMENNNRMKKLIDEENYMIKKKRKN